MASSYSILRDYGDYVSPGDLNLMHQAIQYKQGKYDANRLKIDSQIEQLANLDLVKPVDKQYFNERISTVIDMANQYGTMDLSENGITRGLQNHIKQALDTTVMNAYVSSNEIRKQIRFFKEGSVFPDYKKYYGRNVSSGKVNPAIEYGFAFPLKCSLEEDK